MYGLGDWFSPSCTPGEPGCVPHWYCYVPGMATPDCFRSFVEGTKELASVAGGAVGSTVGAVATGVTSGLVEGFIGGGGSTANTAPSMGPWAWLAVGVGVFALMTLAQPKQRRYGR